MRIIFYRLGILLYFCHDCFIKLISNTFENNPLPHTITFSMQQGERVHVSGMYYLLIALIKNVDITCREVSLIFPFLGLGMKDIELRIHSWG